VSLDVFAADTQVMAPDCPSDAVGLGRVGAQLLGGLASLLQELEQGRSTFGCARTSSPGRATQGSAKGSVQAAVLPAPCSSFRRPGHGPQHPTMLTAPFSLGWREGLRLANVTVAASHPVVLTAVTLVAESVRQADVVEPVQTTIAASDRPAIGRRSPRSVRRLVATGEVGTALWANTVGHRACEFGDEPGPSCLDEHGDPLPGVATLTPERLQGISDIHRHLGRAM
jgi:hypothetical protein